ncbi:MAG: hypothetical protein PHE55_16390, partial [Methylococcaceae bacterium]|nr:hypothetical protein [Methylococcaceae bacterium]
LMGMTRKRLRMTNGLMGMTRKRLRMTNGLMGMTRKRLRMTNGLMGMTRKRLRMIDKIMQWSGRMLMGMIHPAIRTSRRMMIPISTMAATGPARADSPCPIDRAMAAESRCTASVRILSRIGIHPGDHPIANGVLRIEPRPHGLIDTTGL